MIPQSDYHFCDLVFTPTISLPDKSLTETKMGRCQPISYSDALAPLSLHFIQGLFNIGNDIVYVLDPDRQTH